MNLDEYPSTSVSPTPFWETIWDKQSNSQTPNNEVNQNTSQPQATEVALTQEAGATNPWKGMYILLALLAILGSIAVYVMFVL
jgi:cytoskeletal protein RodZ